MVKIMPVNRIATRADLNELIANLDYRSLFINDELMLLSDQPALSAKLAGDFLADCAQAEEVTVKGWSRRFGLAWIAELIGWMARRWL